jgi:hypothetical protein
MMHRDLRHASLRRHYPHQVRRVFLTRQLDTTQARQDPHRVAIKLLELCDNCKFRFPNLIPGFQAPS